ncbi:Putative AC transposase [Apostasia shenzhenica]|uniref:AC transposase n=1 Tax=Apostasia shenzhenica TaxID=1088818 RepID=A0A2I0B0K7_9ASPA|nr:Putative AC transposase [Apostasia shenzhenica]
MSARKVALLAGQQRGKVKKARLEKKMALLPAISDQADMNSMGFDSLNTIDIAVEESKDLVGLETEVSVAPMIMSGKRKRRSIVWSYFELLPAGKDGRQRCKCRICGTSYLYDSRFGTGNMKRHLVSCFKRDARDTGQLMLPKRSSSVPTSTPKIDHDMFREFLVEAVILHNLPFKFVEWEGIRSLLLHLCADLQLGTANFIGSDCFAMYNREKPRLQKILEEIPKINLTYDLWYSLTTDSYLCLTAHYIDKDWNLQKKILNFCFMPPPYDDECLAEKIYTLLIDWGLDKKVSTITLNGAFANGVSVELLKSQMNPSKGLLYDGDFFQLHCCAGVVNLVIQEGLKEIDEATHKIRESIKYVKGSQSAKNKLLDCIKHNSLDDKRGLRQDVPTWWSSTFTMLDSALYYRQAFVHLELCDPEYKYCPSKSEWDSIEMLRKLLAVFYEITNIFSSSKCPTTNLYFPVVFSAYLTLKEEMGNDDEYVRTVATRMFSKFEKYWSDFNTTLVVAVILDPRYKFSFVEWCYKKLYNDGGVIESMKVRDKLFSLYSKYSGANNLITVPKPTISSGNAIMAAHAPASENSFSKETTDVFQEFDSFGSEESVLQKSQLELYLDEPRMDRKAKLDILAYWKGNQFRYPEVSAMARDFLSIPISTVTLENAFDESGRVLDQHLSALNPDILEAFICTRDWLYGENEMTKVNFEELTKNILELDFDVKTELPECSNSGHMLN